MILLFIYCLIAGILNILATMYLQKMKKIIKSKGYKTTWIYNEYSALKKIIKEENSSIEKNEYIRLAWKYIILHRIVIAFAIAFPFIIIIEIKLNLIHFMK